VGGGSAPPSIIAAIEFVLGKNLASESQMCCFSGIDVFYQISGKLRSG
jgi:hypothetical protein